MSVLKKLSPRSWKNDPRPSVSAQSCSVQAETDDAVLDFFRASPNERSLFDHLDHRGDPRAPSRSHLGQVAQSAASVFTKDSVLDHITQLPPAIPLPALCDLINQHLSLQRAQIRSAEVYSQVGRVKHRFIILELFRDGKAPIWLRLDRHRQGSLARIIFRLGADLARDEAMLSADKRSLVGSAKLENRDLFMTNSTLGEFSLFIGVISRELVVYTIWPENCYFFCSLIQQHLDAEGEGEYVQGTLPYPELAANVRRRVQEGVRLVYHIPSPFSFAALLETVVSQQEWPDLDELATRLTNLTDSSVSSFQERSKNVARCSRLSAQLATHLTASGRDDDAILVLNTVYESFRALRNWSLLASPESPISSRIDIAHFLHSFHTLLLSLNHHDLALPITAETIAVERELYGVDPLRWRKDLAASYRTRCICLRKAQRFEDACEASSENVLLSRLLYHHDKEKHSQDLAGALQLHGIALCEARRSKEACDACAEDVALVRGMTGRNPDEQRQAQSTSLRYYSIALRAAQRQGDACDASTESVAIMRSPYEKDPDSSRDVLSSALHQHSVSLREMGRYDEACEVGAESVALRRLLYASDARKHREQLSTSLDEYSRALRAARRKREACVTRVDAIVVKHGLCATSSLEDHSDLVKSLINETALLQDLELFSEAVIVASEAVRLDRRALSQHQTNLFSASSEELLRQCDQILSNLSLLQVVDGAEVLALRRELCARDPSRYGDLFRSRLKGHLQQLRGRNLAESCRTGSDEVSFWRTLSQDAREKYQIYLQLALRHLAIALREAGRFSEACDVGAEDVSLTRVLYGINSKKWRPDLSHALTHYEVALRNVGRTSEACDAGAEDVALMRVLCEDDPERWRADLSTALHHYGRSLLGAGRTSEACDVGAENLSLKRILYEANPMYWRQEFSFSLHQYGVSLRKAGRRSEACDVALEAVHTSRQDLKSDPKNHRKQTDYRNMLRNCCLSLRSEVRIQEAMELEEELAIVDPLESWRN